MRRRTAGIGAINKDKRKAELLKDKGMWPFFLSTTIIIFSCLELLFQKLDLSLTYTTNLYLGNLIGDSSNHCMYVHFSGNALQENAFAEMAKQTETFRSKLENFAHDHKNDIRKDPEFRRHFQGKLEFRAMQQFLLHILLNSHKKCRQMFRQFFFVKINLKSRFVKLRIFMTFWFFLLKNY